MKQILMTSPSNFGVQYEINPWMIGNAGKINITTAVQQWAELRNTLLDLGVDVVVLPAPPQYCPDAVFTANAGLIYKNSFVPSRFAHEERAVEEPYFINWFLKYHFLVESGLPTTPRQKFAFEGAGDALFSHDRSSLWYGFGKRSTIAYKAVLDELFENTRVMVRGLELVNPSFYHLDTCFCPLDSGELLWYPEAFSKHSQMVIESWFEGREIKVDRFDAESFACNAVSVGDNVVTPFISDDLRELLHQRGYTVYQLDMSEFMKAGGACKCLTLEVVE